MNISPQTWRKISELLETALDLSGDERDTWLRGLPTKLSPDEQDVLGPLKKLLAQQACLETNDVLLASPVIQSALLADRRSNKDTSSELRPNAVVGAYRLIRELGRGGMGAVWLAEQVDGRLQRTVALKLPFAGPQQRHIAKRFLQERDILARLEHPNIARIYDADAANPDRPFLVLEYVDGVPIDEYCRARELPVRARLQLFRQVFGALQYAHTHLVIHRDLKPSNILVTPEGVVRLLDFGIAKVLKEDNKSNTVMTEVGSVVMTPNFASPEQVIGAELTTASDVYALGVVLYELLTDARPYEVKQEGRRALEDAIVAADIIKPSEAARAMSSEQRAKQIAKELQGDLDTILLKALKKRPAERYPTVAAFADDVERYLAGEMVLAQADSALYRLRKFAGRHRLAVGAASAVLASLSIGLTVALWQLHTARVAQKRAEDVKEFIASIFRSADPNFTGNHSMTAAELLALGKQRIDSELQGEPPIAMELLNVVGESQANLQQNVAARATLEQAIALGKQALPQNDPMIAQAQSKLAGLYFGDQEWDGGKALLAQSIPTLRRAGPSVARSLSNALRLQAFVDSDEGQHDLAVNEAHEAYEVARAALGPTNSETILSKSAWAEELFLAKRPHEALPPAKEAFEAATSIAKPGERLAALTETEGLYGQVLLESNDLEAGIEHLEHAIATSEKVYGPKSQQKMALLANLMRAQFLRGDMDGVIAAAKQSYESANSEAAAARPLVNLGDSYLRARRLTQAESYLRESIQAEEKFDAGNGSWLQVAQASYAETLSRLGHVADARLLLQKNTLLVGDSKAGITMPHWTAMGFTYGAAREWQASESAYRQLLERTINSTASARWRAIALNGIGLAQLEQKHTMEAEQSLHEAYQAARDAFARPTPTQTDIEVNLTRVLLTQSRPREALPLIEAADRYWQSYAANDCYAGEAAYWHAQTLAALGNAPEARSTLGRSAELLRKPGADRCLIERLDLAKKL